MRTTFLKFALIALAAFIPGCKSCTDCFFVDKASQTNSVSTASSFSNERYVWETWQFSTNAVIEKVVK